MKVKIQPHKAGMPGVACMPLVDNIPYPSNLEWKLTECPVCGRECWETPMLAVAKKMGVDGVACTDCALRGRTKP